MLPELWDLYMISKSLNSRFNNFSEILSHMHLQTLLKFHQTHLEIAVFSNTVPPAELFETQAMGPSTSGISWRFIAVSTVLLRYSFTKKDTSGEHLQVMVSRDRQKIYDIELPPKFKRHLLFLWPEEICIHNITSLERNFPILFCPSRHRDSG